MRGVGPAFALAISCACIPEDITNPIGFNPTHDACPEPPGRGSWVPDRAQFRRVIEDLVVHDTFVANGPEFDDTLIVGCEVNDPPVYGIKVSRVKNLWIVGCTIRSAQVGIALDVSAGTEGVVIADNDFRDVRRSPIAISQEENEAGRHVGTVVVGNRVEGAELTGIKAYGRDLRVEGNSVCGTLRTSIEVAGTGTVARNLVLSTGATGIVYLGSLRENSGILIENNIVTGEVRSDAMIVQRPLGGRALVRFNTAMAFQPNTAALRGVGEAAGGLDVVGNLLIHRDDADQALVSNANVATKNLLTDDLAVLEEVTGAFARFRLAQDSAGMGFADGVGDFPATDFEGDPRTGGRLDVGADQRNP